MIPLLLLLIHTQEAILPLAFASLALGAYQAYEGMRGIKELSGQKRPNYSLTPELKQSWQETQDEAKRGLTPEAMATAKGNIEGLASKRYKLATDMSGGNLSKAIGGAVNYGSLGAYSNLAKIDSDAHLANIREAHRMSQVLQGQQNMATSEDIRHRYRMEDAFGGAFRVGTENIANSLNLTQSMDWYKNLLGGGGAGATKSLGVSPLSITPRNPTQAPNMAGAPIKPSLENFMATDTLPFSQYDDFSQYGLNQPNNLVSH